MVKWRRVPRTAAPVQGGTGWDRNCAGKISNMDPKSETITTPLDANAERLLDLDEVARLLGGISTRSVRRLIARGDLPPPVKVLSAPRLYTSDVRTYLDGLKEKRTALVRRRERRET